MWIRTAVSAFIESLISRLAAKILRFGACCASRSKHSNKFCRAPESSGHSSSASSSRNTSSRDCTEGSKDVFQVSWSWSGSIKLLVCLRKHRKRRLRPTKLRDKRTEQVFVSLLPAVCEREIECGTCGIRSCCAIRLHVLDKCRAEDGLPATSFSKQPEMTDLSGLPLLVSVGLKQSRSSLRFVPPTGGWVGCRRIRRREPLGHLPELI